MGLVKREGDRFSVTSPSLRGRRSSYEVWRDEAGKVRCSCLEFEEHVFDQPSFRCEHILAVKHALAVKNTETVAAPPQPAPTPLPEPENESISSPDSNHEAPEMSASSSPPAHNAVAVTEERSPFEREHKSSSAQAEPDAAPFSNDEEQMNNNQFAEAEMPQLHIANRENSEAQPTSVEQRVPVAVLPLAFANVLRSLRQPVDPKLVKTREGWKDRSGNMHLVEYVEWHTVADLLDRLTPTWSHSVRNIVQIGETVAVTAAITIDGVTREGIGTGAADNETGIKKAEHDALKRAAIKFGIARDLYQRESDVIETQGAALQAGEFPRDPLAKSMADLVTPKQLGMIRALGREAQVEVDEECQAIARCKTDELSKRAASSFIDHLKGLAQESTSDSMRRAS
ncbi:MAG: Rad52/Rad22 family DNA repair protein [Pyrinomonadaceae bacterium]